MTNWLYRYAILLAVCTLLLLVAGASVTSNDAGLAVPDWPLSYGKIMPEMTGGIFYEHGHRMVATTAGLLTIGLAIWLWRADERRWMRRLGLAALGGVIVQGLLGGLTVKLLLPKPVSITHASIAQLFFSTTVAIALFTSPSWKRGPQPVEDSGWPPLRWLALTTAAALLAQVALGAAYRHHALGLIPHVAGGLVVTAVVLYAAILVLSQHPEHRPLRRAALSMLAITLFQVFLGIAAYMSRISTSDSPQPMPVMVLFTVLHVAVGGLAMASSVVFAIQVLRNVRPEVLLPARGVRATS